MQFNHNLLIFNSRNSASGALYNHTLSVINTGFGSNIPRPRPPVHGAIAGKSQWRHVINRSLPNALPNLLANMMTDRKPAR